MKNHRCPNLTNSTNWFPASVSKVAKAYPNFLIKECSYQGPATTEPDPSTGNPNNSDSYFAGSSTPGEEGNSDGGHEDTTKGGNTKYPCIPNGAETTTGHSTVDNQFICVKNIERNGVQKAAYNGTFMKSPEMASATDSTPRNVYYKSDICGETLKDDKDNFTRIIHRDLQVGTNDSGEKQLRRLG